MKQLFEMIREWLIKSEFNDRELADVSTLISKRVQLLDRATIAYQKSWGTKDEVLIEIAENLYLLMLLAAKANIPFDKIECTFDTVFAIQMGKSMGEREERSPETHYKEIDTIMNRFKNGKTKYNKSALFHQIVQQLARGVSEYDIIESLIDTTEDTTNAFRHYISQDQRPIKIG